MGILISRFKRKKTTLEVLEKLEKDITDIEKYRTNTEQRQRRIVGQLIVYSVGAYVLAAAIFYFYWFPSTLREQLICVAPLLLFPILIIFLKRIVTFHYSRKITKNEQKLTDLRAEKKQLLEDVMDKETYKVARTILEKFAPEQLRSKGMEQHMTPVKPNAGKGPLNSAVRPTPLQSSTPMRPVPPGLPPTELRRRTLPSALGNPGANPGGPPSSLSSESLSAAAMQRSQFLAGTPVHRPSVNGQSFTSEFRPPGPPMPRPVLPRERTYFERVVEYVVGDGPSNRFALICSSCDSHNGMALKEEFEYLPFRCCYCYYFNPARKQRPQAPRLSPVSGLKSQGLGQNSVNTTKNPDTSDSEKNSGSDSSDEDSGPELLPLDNSGVEKLKPDTKSEGETTLDREAEDFLKSLADKEKGDEEPVTASTKKED